jgi:hydrogenase maturation protease
MSDRKNKTVILALGNDILGDDGVGFYAARELRQKLDGKVDVEESGEAGLALLELLEGYDHALIIDAILTGTRPPGTVIRFDRDDFRKVIGPSPHYAGLPEVLAMAERLGIEFPSEIGILAMEVEDPYTLREGLSPSVEEALPHFVEAALSILGEWKEEEVCTNTR